MAEVHKMEKEIRCTWKERARNENQNSIKERGISEIESVLKGRNTKGKGEGQPKHTRRPHFCKRRMAGHGKDAGSPKARFSEERQKGGNQV